jgi:hypothetical protein
MGINAAFGITAALLAVVVLGADEHAQFPFHHAVMFVGVFDDPFAHLDIFFKRLVAAVNHHTGEPFVNALFAQLEGIAVIEVDGDGDIGGADGRFDEFLEINGAGILAGALGDLEHDRRFFLLAGLDDGLEQLHVIDVEGAEGVFAFEGFGEQVCCMC